MSERKVYQNLIWNSQRWDGFEFRPGDIILSTPPKSGTTWTQMLLGMLVFDSTEFHDTMDNISPWLDMNTRSQEDVFSLLGAQQHRRFIKTHTPLDGLPMRPEVTYILVARDPRDAAISMEHHFANMDFDSFIATRVAAVGGDDLEQYPPPPPPPEDPVERMRVFLDSPEGVMTFNSVVGHLHDAWLKRHEPNVALFHYRDYQIDLPGELQRLAGVLGIELDEEKAQRFAEAAGIDSMRERAEELAPDTGRSHWLDTARFFRTGGRGEWADRFTEELAAQYERQVNEIAEGDSEFVAWLHEGRRSTGMQLPQ